MWSEQITDRLEVTGGTSWRAAQVAAIETRDRKEAIDLPLAREQWWERATSTSVKRTHPRLRSFRGVKGHLQ